MITAIAADDYLVDILVLKGGNALELIHEIGSRASVDLDFSMATDFDDPEVVGGRLLRSLEERFDAEGLFVFDFEFGPRPHNRESGSKWGGYGASFKLIEQSLADRLGGSLNDMRRQSQVSGPDQKRKFKIDISAYECVDDRVEVEVDHYTCYVYTIEMIAAEKLRAVCQQHPDYEPRKHPTARARDFYDVVSILLEGGVAFESAEFQVLVQGMFAAKSVPLSLLSDLDGQREFHREDWASVENAVSKKIRDFDYYFDYVVEEVRKLEALWIEDSPS